MIEVVEELGEEVLAGGLVVGGGVVVLGLQGGSELDGGLEEGASATVRLSILA